MESLPNSCFLTAKKAIGRDADRRLSSRAHELVAPLRKRGLDVEEGTLEAGDVMFEGRGERGASVLVGVEVKKLPELVQAFRTERLQGHQAPKMQALYDFSYLLIEGEVLSDAQGRLLARTGRRGFRALPGGMALSELLKRLFVLQLARGLCFRSARTRGDTLQYLEALYRVWTDTALDAHKSHIAIYRAPTPVPISEFRVFMQSIDGIGFKASLAIEQHFKGDLRRALLASENEWRQIDGVGLKTAVHVMDVLEGRAKS